MNTVNKPFISNNFNNKNVSDRTHNDKEFVQYHNPHQRKLNVLSENHHNNEYNDDNDEHNDDYDEYNDDCYDIDEVFGGRNHSIEGHNPGYNVKHTLSSIDREVANLPCYAELQGKCPSQNTCRYSHDVKLLQKTRRETLEELNESKYRPGESPKHTWDPGKCNNICSLHILCSLIANSENIPPMHKTRNIVNECLFNSGAESDNFIAKSFIEKIVIYLLNIFAEYMLWTQ